LTVIDLHVQQLEQPPPRSARRPRVTVDRLPVSFAVIFDMLAVNFLTLRHRHQKLCANDSDKTAPLLSQWMVSDCRHNRLTACLAAVKTDANHLEESTYQQVLNAGNLESLLSLQTLKRAPGYPGERGDCRTARSHTGQPPQRCSDLHFRRIVQSHTDTSLGDCSFLNTCFHIDTCKYVHYEIDADDLREAKAAAAEAAKPKARDSKAIAVPQKPHYQDEITLYPPQWIQCDIRHLDMTVLGKFAVIMGDPALGHPHGAALRHHMKSLDIPCLQDSGYIFLWVTGERLRPAVDCLRLWGYKIIGELIWVTGLNHGKEHCIIGVKGSPKNVNLGLDCDVIVSEVRATSHKPDEIYGIIERLSPGTRKLELFGRPHNVQPNWITLLDGVKTDRPDVVAKFRAKYPDGV
uniref:mRNA m(6)A methyltransferase n=1 Tax=Macrostomum lignano TaxID=282301 RepID=A0A1I8F995_9PLAT